MKSLIYILALVVAVVGCSSNQSGNQKPAPKSAEVKDGDLILNFKDGASDAEVARILSQFEKTELMFREEKIYFVHDEMLNGNEKVTAERLSKDPAIEFADPNNLKHTMEVPTKDPYFLRLWGLKNYGQDAPNGVEGVEGADIGVLKAWDKSKGSKSVRVAILDTGCDYKHEDLMKNIWVNEAEKNGTPGVDDNNEADPLKRYVDDFHGWSTISDALKAPFHGQAGKPDPFDDHGHGTHVAGTIGAVGGNAIGVVGINQEVSIACVKFLDANGSGSDYDELNGLKYILAQNFDVVNGSYGGGAENPTTRQILEKGIKQGILFVFAAGNDSSNNDQTDTWPANYCSELDCIAVAATDSRDQIAEFSNYGQKKVHIAAPGVNIMSTVPSHFVADQGADTPPYATFSGTSMATPHVVGAAALLIASDATFKGKPLAVRERLMATAEFKPSLASMVASGRLNVARALVNDTSGNPTQRKDWTEIPLKVETPRLPTEKINNVWEIKPVPGAKAIRVHIVNYNVDNGFDVATIYDQNYRHAMTLVGIGVDIWSPVMLGDTARLKFSNAVVSIEGGEAHANFLSEGVVIDKVEVLK